MQITQYRSNLRRTMLFALLAAVSMANFASAQEPTIVQEVAPKTEKTLAQDMEQRKDQHTEQRKDQHTEQRKDQHAEQRSGQKSERNAQSTNQHGRFWIRVDPRRCNLVVFTRPNQGIEGEFASADDIRVSAVQGTVFSVDANKTVIHSGAAYLNCKKGTAAIILPAARIQIEQGLSILLEISNNSRETRIAVFGKDTKAVAILSSQHGRKTLSLKPGQYISMPHGEMSEQAQEFAPGKSDFQENALSLMNEQTSQPILKDRDAPLHIFASGGSEFSFLSPDTLSLRKGEFFTQVPDQLFVRTNLAELSATRNALIDIEANMELVRGKSFCPDGRPTLSFGKQQKEILAGQEVLICSHEITAKELLPADGVGRRDSQPLKMASEFIYGSVSDFSVSSFLNEMTYLQPVKNPLDKEEKKIRERILKTAIALLNATASHGPYRSTPKSPPGQTRAPSRGA